MSIREATKASFSDLVKNGVAVVDFFSDDCLPCRLMEKVFEEVDLDMPYLNIIKVNASKYPTLSRSLEIMAYPTVLFYKNGEELRRHIGFMDAESMKKAAAGYLYAGKKPSEKREK